MPNEIEEYLAALRLRLRCKPPEKDRILSEVEDHLLEAVDGEVERGVPPEEAPRIVIARFGDPETVARWWSEVYPTENGGGSMWQRFTERARRVVFFAQEEAARLGENFVGTEHLLLGLVRESDSVAGRILDRLGIAGGRIRAEIEKQVTQGQGNLGQDMQLTPRAKRVVDLAYEEARLLDNNYIGTEHLLLGLIREGDGLAARVLVPLGANLERTREIVRSMQEAVKPQKSAQQGVEIPIFLRRGNAPPVPKATWAKFNERARRAVFFGQQEAERLGHNWIGTEHVLLGILRENESVGAQMLERLGVTTESLRADLEQKAPRGQRNPEQPLEATPRARRAIELAYEEAQQLGHNWIGTEHLLLGLIREGEGLAGKSLAELGVTPEKARSVLEAGEFPPAPPTNEPIIWEAPFWLPPETTAPPGVPWTKLTDGTHRVLFLAEEEARRFGQTRVDPQFLLLGLLRDDNLATRLLERMGVPLARLRGEIERQLRPGPGWGEDQPLEADTRQVFVLGWEEAGKLNHNYLGTEHLLLGFLRQEETHVGRILVKLGASLERARREIPMVGPKWIAVLEARRRLEEAEAAYRALLAAPE